MKINIQKIAYRVIPFVVALTIAFSAVVIGEPVKASAASVEVLDWRKMATATENAGSITYKVSIPEKYMTVNRKISGKADSVDNSLTGSYSSKNQSSETDDYGQMYITFHMPSAKEQTPNYYFDVRTAPDSAQYGADFTVVHSANYAFCYEYDLSMYFAFSFYDKDYKYLDSYESQTAVYRDFSGVETETSYSMRGDRWEDALPDNARYFIACFVVVARNVEKLDDTGSINTFEFNYQLKDYLFYYTYNISNGQQEQVGNAVEDMSGSAGELGAIGDQLAGVNKPDADSLNVSVDGLVPYQAMLAYTAPIQVLWENPTLFGMLMIVVTLVIVSWVFFGKKG